MSPREITSRSLTILVAAACASMLVFAGIPAFAALGGPQEAAELSAPATPRIVESIDESRLATLKGNVYPAATAKNDRGAVSPDLPMTDLILVLKRSPERQAEFDRFVASQYDSASPNFHHWLEPEQIGENFGPAQSDIDTVANWLRGHGFSVDEVATDRMTIRFSGSATQVQEAFHTEIHNLEVKGEKHIANMTDPKIPQALTPAVVGVKALHNFFPRPLHTLGSLVRRNSERGGWERIASPTDASPKAALASAKPRPQFGSVGGSGSNTYIVEDVAPYDFATIYNVLPLWNASIDGTGQTIAIAGTSKINPTDVATFRSTFGLPAFVAQGQSGPTLTQTVANGTDPGECTSTSSTATCTIDDLLENSLDVEWSGAVAKGASIVLVVSGANSTTTDTLYSSEHYIVQNKTAQIMNVSYGLCELGLAASGNTEYYDLWQTASAEGIAVFVSTGDSGSAGCDSGDNSSDTIYAAEYGLAVSGISSTPYNTAVGGTDFNWGSTASPYWNSSNTTNLASAAGYIPETPWNDTCVNPLVVPVLESDASQVGVSGVTDAETACNFVGDYYDSIYQNYGVDLSFLVNTVGGTGGKSSCINGDGSTTASCTEGYPKPTWQAALTPSDASRDLPDISFFASNGFNGSAYLICVSEVGSCTYSASTEPTAQEVGGTSVASPAMAGVMALINQKSGATQGTPNTELYTLAGKQNYSSCSAESVTASSTCYFNDIDTGTNAQPCDAGLLGGNSPNCTVLHSGDGLGILSGYSAVKGYDLATGLGSLNVANVVNAWPKAATAPAVTLTPTLLNFPSTTINTAAATQAITLKNVGTAALAVSGISITGANASSFSETNTCGTSVAVAATCTITVTFKPTATGALAASVSIADNATGSPQTVSLTGTGVAVAAPAVTLTPTSLTFASTTINTAAATQAITLKNTGTAALTVSGISITGANASSFSETNTCGTSVAVAASCTITVTFKPTATGALAASVSIADNATGSPQTVALSGTGAAAAVPVVSLSPTALTFASTPVGTLAAAQNVTLKNTGGAALTITSITLTGANASSYTVSKTCASSLAAGSSCTITVDFKPTASGTLTAAVSIADNAAGSPQTISITGTGSEAAATLSASSLTFAGTLLGATAPTQAVTLKNTGNAALTVSGISLSGTNATSFSTTNSCGTSLAAAATCTIYVSFKPVAIGPLTALISVADSATGSPQKITLSGTGTGAVAQLSHASLGFGNTLVGAASTPQSVVLTNTGNLPLGFTSTTPPGFYLSGTGATSFSQTNNCTVALAPGASCTITVTFKPTTTGSLTASLKIADNANPTAQFITLAGSGLGPEVRLSANRLAYASTQIGEAAATQSFTITNYGNATLGLGGTGRGFSITGTGASSYSQTNTCGNGLFAGGSCTVTVTFTPKASGSLPAILNIADNTSNSPQMVVLAGTGSGTAVSLSATTLTFASTTVGSTAATQTVTLTDTSASTLALGGSGRGFSITGTDATSFTQTNTCGTAIAAGKSCVITVTFKPEATGALTANLVITDNAYPTTQTVVLKGTGK